MTAANPLGISFVGSRMDRSDHIRCNPDLLAAAMTPAARLLRLDGLDPVLTPEGELAWGSLAEAPENAELVFLGRRDNRACFAAVPAAGSTAPANPALWQAIATLDADDLAIYGGARSMVDWHARHRFCARCGQPTEIAKGGWQRTCRAGAHAHVSRQGRRRRQ